MHFFDGNTAGATLSPLTSYNLRLVFLLRGTTEFTSASISWLGTGPQSAYKCVHEQALRYYYRQLPATQPALVSDARLPYLMEDLRCVEAQRVASPDSAALESDKRKLEVEMAAIRERYAPAAPHNDLIVQLRSAAGQQERFFVSTASSSSTSAQSMTGLSILTLRVRGGIACSSCTDSNVGTRAAPRCPHWKHLTAALGDSTGTPQPVKIVLVNSNSPAVSSEPAQSYQPRPSRLSLCTSEVLCGAVRARVTVDADAATSTTSYPTRLIPSTTCDCTPGLVNAGMCACSGPCGPTSPCSHALNSVHTWGAPVASSSSTRLFTSTSVIAVTVYHRVCTCCGSKLLYDGRAAGIFMMNAEVAVDEMYMASAGEVMFRSGATYTATSAVHQSLLAATGGEGKHIDRGLWGRLYQSYLSRVVHPDASHGCPCCGDSPPVVIADATAIGLLSRNRYERPVLERRRAAHAVKGGAPYSEQAVLYRVAGMQDLLLKYTVAGLPPGEGVVPKGGSRAGLDDDDRAILTKMLQANSSSQIADTELRARCSAIQCIVLSLLQSDPRKCPAAFAPVMYSIVCKSVAPSLMVNADECAELMFVAAEVERPAVAASSIALGAGIAAATSALPSLGMASAPVAAPIRGASPPVGIVGGSSSSSSGIGGAGQQLPIPSPAPAPALGGSNSTAGAAAEAAARPRGFPLAYLPKLLERMPLFHTLLLSQGDVSESGKGVLHFPACMVGEGKLLHVLALMAHSHVIRGQQILFRPNVHTKAVMPTEVLLAAALSSVSVASTATSAAAASSAVSTHINNIDAPSIASSAPASLGSVNTAPLSSLAAPSLTAHAAPSLDPTTTSLAKRVRLSSSTVDDGGSSVSGGRSSDELPTQSSLCGPPATWLRQFASSSAVPGTVASSSAAAAAAAAGAASAAVHTPLALHTATSDAVSTAASLLGSTSASPSPASTATSTSAASSVSLSSSSVAGAAAVRRGRPRKETAASVAAATAAADAAVVSAAAAWAAEVQQCEEFFDDANAVAHTDTLLGQWFIPGLRRYRRMESVYAADITGSNASYVPDGGKSGLCSKQYPSTRSHTPGILSGYCQHGFLLFYKFLEDAESPVGLFRVLYERFSVAPSIVVYDNACHLHRACLNREPVFFARTQFLCDRLHWANHRNCSPSYSCRVYERSSPLIRSINSQSAEQSHSQLQRIATQLSHMNRANAMRYLHMFFSHFSHNKMLLLISRAQRRGGLAACRLTREELAQLMACDRTLNRQAGVAAGAAGDDDGDALAAATELMELGGASRSETVGDSEPSYYSADAAVSAADYIA